MSGKRFAGVFNDYMEVDVWSLNHDCSGYVWNRKEVPGVFSAESFLAFMFVECGQLLAGRPSYDEEHASLRDGPKEILHDPRSSDDVPDVRA